MSYMVELPDIYLGLIKKVCTIEFYYKQVQWQEAGIQTPDEDPETSCGSSTSC